MPARIRRTFVFTDIVESTRLAEILGDAAWSELIRWHDQALRSIVAAHGGEEIKATGDGFFLAFDDPDRAIECAIAIQRRFAEHRQSEGFAPGVRIGVHEADATRSGLDYIGGGVNLAARVAAQANGGEILVSASTFTSAHREFMEGARRSAALKGISMPVELVPVVWR
jgi:class 3 adenylate cyclase